MKLTMNPNQLFDAQRKHNQSSSSGNSSGGTESVEDARIALYNQLAGANAELAMLAAQQQRNLTFTTQDAAQRSVMEVLARHSTSNDEPAEETGNGKASDDKDNEVKERHGKDSDENGKRKAGSEAEASKAKKKRTTSSELPTDDGDGPAPVPAAEKGINYFADADVLSGRGGGTNVHPGNRHFRDLINLHRRAYLKARKNDKPAISRMIVRVIRENNGRFLRRDEKQGLWFEIGDDAAREKTSQALRQRAPEMRKILFESEREQALQEAEDQILQRQQLLASGLGGQDMASPAMSSFNTFSAMLGQQGLNPLMAMQMNKLGGQGNEHNPNDPYTQLNQNLLSAALLGSGMSRFANNSA